MDKRVFFLAISTIAIMLSGCETSHHYVNNRLIKENEFTENMNSWLGSSEDALLSKWGAPQKEYATSSAKFLTYVSSHQETVQGYGPTYMQRNIGGNIFSVPVGGQPSKTFQFSCEITWIVKKGKIDNWNARGNG